MKATILYDEAGTILSIAKIGNLKEVGSKFQKVGMIPRQGQQTLEVELLDEH